MDNTHSKNMKKQSLMNKLASAMETNTQSVKGTLQMENPAEGYKQPEDGKQEVTEGVWESYVRDNPTLLSENFKNHQTASQQMKSDVGKYLDTKNYETRQPLLRKYASDGLIPSPDTLREKMAAVFGEGDDNT